MALGALQQLQAILALTVYLQVTPGIVISPGSSVLLTGVLFTILLVYIREDAPEARKLIYGLLTANLTVAILSFLVGLHLKSRFVINTFGLRQEIFFQGFRVMLVGTVALILDVFLILMLYEAIAARIKGSLFLRVYTSMFLVLAVDTLLFVTGSFVEKPNYWSILGSALVGKTFAAALYSMILTWYLRVFQPTSSLSERDEIALRDLFGVLTYRQRYEAIRSQATQDPLTHIYNRGFFEDCLSDQLARNHLLSWSTTLLMIDLDGFKALNDAFGHQFGDQILAIAGQALKDSLRTWGFPAAMGVMSLSQFCLTATSTQPLEWLNAFKRTSKGSCPQMRQERSAPQSASPSHLRTEKSLKCWSGQRTDGSTLVSNVDAIASFLMTSLSRNPYRESTKHLRWASSGGFPLQARPAGDFGH